MVCLNLVPPCPRERVPASCPSHNRQVRPRHQSVRRSLNRCPLLPTSLWIPTGKRSNRPCANVMLPCSTTTLWPIFFSSLALQVSHIIQDIILTQITFKLLSIIFFRKHPTHTITQVHFSDRKFCFLRYVLRWFSRH